MASKTSSAETLEVVLDEMRSHSIILDDMRAQNRVTIEAVESARHMLEQRIDRLERETRSRDAALEAAIRDLKVVVQQHTVDIRELQVGVRENSVDIRDLARKVDALARLEERVAALEKRTA